MREMRTPRSPLGSSHPSFLLTGLEPVLSLGTQSRREAFRLGHLALRAPLEIRSLEAEAEAAGEPGVPAPDLRVAQERATAAGYRAM